MNKTVDIDIPTPLWMRYPKCPVCGNYVIVNVKRQPIRRQDPYRLKRLLIELIIEFDFRKYGALPCFQCVWKEYTRNAHSL